MNRFVYCMFGQLVVKTSNNGFKRPKIKLADVIVATTTDNLFGPAQLIAT